MKVSDRLAAIDRIARELQSRYGYEDIASYLTAFGLIPKQVTVNSKWVYAKAGLATADLNTLGRILEDLGMETPAGIASRSNPPENWRGVTGFRLFISHISKDKDKATRLKACLADYAISGFVAHEDVFPTLEWQDEIERALFSMDAFVAVHTPGFSNSIWTNQEIGFALGRGIKVISFKMGEDPAGFISKRQALARRQRSAEEIAQEIDSLLTADPRTVDRLNEAKRARSGAAV